jgi:hypothetical protein
MRKPLLTAVLAALAFIVVPAASAGPATVNANGDFGVVDFDVAPPVAGAPSMVLSYHAFFGNRNGERLPDDERTTIRLPRGSRSNGPLFAQCRLPQSSSDVGSDRCSNATKIGSGTFEADARPLVAEPVTGELTVYNGEQVAGTPTVIIRATTQVGGSAFSSELDFAVRNSGGAMELVTIPPPEGTATGVFTVSRVDLTIGRTMLRRVGRRRVPTGVLVPPRTCRGRWTFSETEVLPGGRAPITARDDVACLRGP